MINRRALIASLGAAGTVGAISTRSTWANTVTGAESEKLFVPYDGPKISTLDRLPLTWHQGRMRALQARLAAAGYDGILLTDQWNVIYFTGLFYTATERLEYAFIPTVGNFPIWFYPALDRDVIRSWWYDDGEMYFDWPNVEGAAPQDGKVVRGQTQDLWRWVMDGLKRRGFAGKKLAADTELVPSAQKTVTQVLRRPMASAASDCVYLRERKTPEELSLTRRAYSYLERIHAFARDLILTHGTDLTDFEVRHAATKYGTDLIMADIKHDGSLHNAVGIVVDFVCRTGRTNAYGHTNQFLYSRIERGQALQVMGVVQIGGWGGELYRPYMIAPRTGHMETLWTVVRDCCLMQKDLSRNGTKCSDVAFAIHQTQVKRGMQKYIYHRVAHGQGMEGHQAPYIALGDHTVLEPGMCFSVEPGLFDPETGIGTNFSDTIAIQAQGPAVQMSRLPWSEEWGWITI